MFDSGIGGLTVFKEVRRLLPREHIIYLGDTARVPYGNKSPYTVTRYALETALFLLAKGIKALVIACNTSSALSLNILKKKLPIPVLGVIDPAAALEVKVEGEHQLIGAPRRIPGHRWFISLGQDARDPRTTVVEPAQA